ncbi:hypothetical protein E6P09_06375 [Haloferax mediterranei ATCC 33500]|uniref:Uncharacterized protein n=1 Tax=Haloferax mediterranei (strain ATCC 33500 / DSM 1411 / JCM 8866 / NBRC 14739 / NCIMB 2177 / R-4) TaxID=523841 RepID=M0J043_HALMT|nr:hypothetical protein [Haloferax mediterranei]AHZ22217.1 hypothetical protein BM92_05910 [Haloferax mediterranei ATCC 33500]EMA02336.1 hypothetical protein C439_07135 [Haloferax mediterranei ATCC 33500]MDX5988481.1 hypothetical protein [Haloferax mediterranei ATCC 33500]QCQ74899.1 hypothetical protein E6P09_06375 [Haloferax mediterranei ATCC 33500]
MSIQSPVRALPRFLTVEVFLVFVFLCSGVVPYVVFTKTELTVPPGFGNMWGIALGALGILWAVLLIHAAVDGWRLVRNRKLDGLGGRSVIVHSLFRVVETLSALVAPVLPFMIMDRSSDAPLPPGAAVAIALFVAAPLAIASLTVLLHAGWMLWTARVSV